MHIDVKHYLVRTIELTEIGNKISSVKNIHVSATEENGKLIFLHKIKEGAVDKSYGVNAAALVKMPNEIINRANEILKTYESNSNKKKEGGEEQLFFALPVKDD